MKVDDSLLEKIWLKGQPVDGYDSDKIRKDACGAWMLRDQYGKDDSSYGWVIDHIVPQKFLKERGVSDEKIDNLQNLRPLNIGNNLSKSDSYPDYVAKIKAVQEKNVEDERYFSVNASLQEDLKQLFGL